MGPGSPAIESSHFIQHSIAATCRAALRMPRHTVHTSAKKASNKKKKMHSRATGSGCNTAGRTPRREPSSGRAKDTFTQTCQRSARLHKFFVNLLGFPSFIAPFNSLENAAGPYNCNASVLPILALICLSPHAPFGHRKGSAFLGLRYQDGGTHVLRANVRAVQELGESATENLELHTQGQVGC